MSILIGRDTRLVVQGITGREGEFHARASRDYGTKVVAGVTPGKGGQTALDGTVPVYDTVAEAVREHGANTSLIFVPAAGAPDAVMEAARLLFSYLGTRRLQHATCPVLRRQHAIMSWFNESHGRNR